MQHSKMAPRFGSLRRIQSRVRHWTYILDDGRTWKPSKLSKVPQKIRSAQTPTTTWYDSWTLNSEDHISQQPHGRTPVQCLSPISGCDLPGETPPPSGKDFLGPPFTTSQPILRSSSEHSMSPGRVPQPGTPDLTPTSTGTEGWAESLDVSHL